MAQNPYVNKVIYGNQTVMDISGDTVTASDVAQGKTFHDATGEQKTGSYVAPTITSITPSLSNPPTLTVGENYTPTYNGYAVSGYRELTPSSISPVYLFDNQVYHTNDVGFAIKAYSLVYPSDSDPDVLTSGTMCRIERNGYAIESYDSKTPSDNNPPTVSSGDIVKMGGAGYLYATQQTGSGVLYTKTGTIPAYTSINQEQTIDTGLSEVKYVLIEGVSSNNNYINQTVLNMDRSFGKQITLIVNSSGQVTSLTSGSTASGLITGTSNTLKISAISGGNITVKGATNVNYLQKDIVWYAG